MAASKLEFSRGDRIAAYEVVDTLDETPLGPTLRAKHTETGKYCRLTVLKPEIAGPDDEASVRADFEKAKSLRHPRILEILDLGRHEGLWFFTAEDFEGQTLRELLHEYKIAGKPFSLKEASQITTHILEALTAIHEAGVYMRTLRPEYVLVNIRYTGPRQATFVAQTRVMANPFWMRVPAGVLAEDEFTRGEAQYMAPELKGFDPEPSARCDVYSAGVIYYEMLTGTAPVGTFQSPTLLRPELPRRVNDIVELAIAASPEDRYMRPSDLAADIQRLFSEPDAAQFGARYGRSSPRVGLALAGAGLIVVAAVAATLFALTRNNIDADEIEADRVRAEVLDAHEMPSPEEIDAILARHPPNMALIPAGPYVSGRLHFEDARAFSGEPLAEVVELDAYLIDLFEHPNLQGARPTSAVSWSEAKAACEEAGKRLCTAQEWEKACKGPRNTVYAYGDFYDESFCGAGIEDLYPSGTRTECRSKWGVFDQSGGFREWTATHPPGKENRALVMGGVRGASARGTRCAFTFDESTAVRDASISFRCCRDVDAPPVAPPDEGSGTEGTE